MHFRQNCQSVAPPPFGSPECTSYRLRRSCSEIFDRASVAWAKPVVKSAQERSGLLTEPILGKVADQDEASVRDADLAL
jgi:hypothetical protein